MRKVGKLECPPGNSFDHLEIFTYPNFQQSYWSKMYPFKMYRKEDSELEDCPLHNSVG